MNVSVKDLLDAGVHFGHQVRRWNPKSKPFVYDNRHGISIINLEKTYDLLEKAAEAIEGIVASGKQVLLVGTKRQAIEPIRELAAATNMPFCVNRWMGGTLTNYETVSNSIAKYKNISVWKRMVLWTRCTARKVQRPSQMARMNRDFEGLLNLQGLPGALFVIDSFNENIAVAEANRLKIPVIALVDSNSDPSVLSHPIPGNDDSTKSIRIIVDVVLDAIQAGSSKRVQAPTKRKDITPVAQEPDFLENEDEPEVTLPRVTMKWTLMTVKRLTSLRMPRMQKQLWKPRKHPRVRARMNLPKTLLSLQRKKLLRKRQKANSFAVTNLL